MNKNLTDMVKLSGIVENCHLKSQILPIFFSNFAYKFTNWRTFFLSRPGILH